MNIEIADDGSVRRVPVPAVGEFGDIITAAIREAAEAVDAEVVEYSGRFMNGAKCIAVVVDDPQAFVERAAVLAVLKSTLGVGEALAAGAAIDDYASSRVVYWPDLANS